LRVLSLRIDVASARTAQAALVEPDSAVPLLCLTVRLAIEYRRSLPEPARAIAD
jgi:hypothetical protein